MNGKPNNPSAFPWSGDAWTDHTGANINTGMTLRDYFAAAAMSGIVSKENWAARGDSDIIAQTSYMLADKMLAEREKGQQ